MFLSLRSASSIEPLCFWLFGARFCSIPPRPARVSKWKLAFFLFCLRSSRFLWGRLEKSLCTEQMFLSLSLSLRSGDAEDGERESEIKYIWDVEKKILTFLNIKVFFSASSYQTEIISSVCGWTLHTPSLQAASHPRLKQENRLWQRTSTPRPLSYFPN